MKLNKRRYFLAAACAAVALATAGGLRAQDSNSVKIGLILPMTGQQQSTGKQEAAAAKLFMSQQGDTVAGKKVELIIKDDAAVPDNTTVSYTHLIPMSLASRSGSARSGSDSPS